MRDEDIKAIARFWEPAAAVKQEDPQRRTNLFWIGPNNAGQRVTMETAMQVGVVWACIDAIAKPIAASDFCVYEREGARKRRELDPHDDPISYMLNVRPNPEMTAQSFRRSLMIAALAWGNGYAENVRDRAGRVREQYLIHPDRMEPYRTPGGELRFECHNQDGSATELTERDLFRIRGPGIMGMVGQNMISHAAATIALSMATSKFASSYFGNGTHLGGIVEVPNGMDDPTFERLKKEFNQNHRGIVNANKVAFIEDGMKWHPVDSDAEKSQLISARQQDVEDICRWFGVPPHKVQHLLRSTNNNIEHQGLEFVRDALRPWAKEMQQEADFKLFSGRGPVRFTRLDLDWAAEGDFKSRMEGLQIGRNMGALNANQVRDAIGYDDIGPEGDIYIVNGANTRLEDVGKNYGAKPGSPAPATPAKEDEDDPQVAAMTSWLASIYDRVERTRVSNPAKDLQAYLDRQLDDIVPHLEKYSAAAQSLAASGGQRVFAGEPAPQVARETVLAIIGAAE